MSLRQFIIGCLVFATLVIPIVQLSFGFTYVDNEESCLIQNDIMLLMAIGGVFELIFFAAAFGFIYASTPSKYKKEQKQSVEQKNQKNGEGKSRAALILIGCITGIFGACAIMFFVLIQLRVYENFQTAQWTNATAPTYCLFTIYSSAFGLTIATYVAFILIFIVAIILLCGIGVSKT